MSERVGVVLAVVVVATLALSGVALAKNLKFTFEDVTLVDGDLVVENGVIEAASKEKKILPPFPRSTKRSPKRL